MRKYNSIRFSIEPNLMEFVQLISNSLLYLEPGVTGLDCAEVHGKTKEEHIDEEVNIEPRKLLELESGNCVVFSLWVLFIH